LRVLVLDQFSDLGGAQRNLLLLLGAMRERSWEAVVGLAGKGQLFERVRDLGFETFSIPCGPFSLGSKSPLDLARFARQLPLLARRIRNWGGAFRPDAIYLNGPRVLPGAALARLRTPALFHAHSYLPRGEMRAVSGFALRRLEARVVACCNFVAAPWKPYLAPSSPSVVFNGVGGPDRPLHRRHAGPPKVGCVGRISPEKGQLDFLAAAAMIHRALPECRFLVYGAPLFSRKAARYGAEVNAAARGLPVEFPGWAVDVYAALADLDVLLVPSRGLEGMPLTILEAFAAGVPVVAFRAGGIPEIVDDGRTGILADSVAQMAESAVSLLAGDPARRRSIAAAARESWSTRFTAERWQRQVLSEIERVASYSAIGARNAQ
jgi:glycosyltransferase involved in cell wall biosynthesis